MNGEAEKATVMKMNAVILVSTLCFSLMLSSGNAESFQRLTQSRGTPILFSMGEVR